MKSKFFKVISVIFLSLICASSTLLVVVTIQALLGISESIGARGLAAGMAIGAYSYSKRVFSRIIYDHIPIKTAIIHPLSKSILYKDSKAADIISAQNAQDHNNSEKQ